MCIQRNDSVNVDFLDGIDCICFAFSHYEPISLVLEASGGGGDYGNDVDAGDGACWHCPHLDQVCTLCKQLGSGKAWTCGKT